MSDFNFSEKYQVEPLSDPKKITISKEAYAQCEVTLQLIDAIKHLSAIIRSKK